MNIANYKTLAAGLLFILPAAFLSAFVPAASPVFAAGNSVLGNGTSLNWAGYVASGGTFTSIAGTWNVPSVAQAQGAMQADATWIGIGGINRPDLIQGGTQAIVSPSGNVTFEAWYELLPQTTQSIPVSIREGDSVTVSLTETAPDANTWTFSFRDNTTGQSYSTTLTYASSLSSAEWIEEMPMSNGSFLPLDNFGTVSFSGGSATENGAAVSIGGADAQTLTMTDGNQVIATPSPLGADGASFTVTRSGSGGGSVPVSTISIPTSTPSAITTTFSARGNGFGVQVATIPTADTRGQGNAITAMPTPSSSQQLLTQLFAQLQALETQVRARSGRR